MSEYLSPSGAAASAGPRTTAGIPPSVSRLADHGVLVGLLCLRSPLQTLVALGLLLGAWWVVSGVIDLVSAAVGRSGRGRATDAILGLVSLVAGTYLLLNPQITLPALIVVACVWLFGIGAIAVLAAMKLRDEARK